VVNRKDFNATLKQLTDCLERMCSGSRFHSDGAATANERAPNFVAVLGMTRSSRGTPNAGPESSGVVLTGVGTAQMTKEGQAPLADSIKRLSWLPS